MEGQSRHIVVNGQYIAHMEIDTQIVGVGYVYNINQPSSLKPECSEAPSHDNAEDIIPDDSSSVSPESNSGSSSPAATNESQEIEEFKYIHIEVTDDNERAKVHKMMCNIVRLPRMQQVCDELYILMKKRKVLCTINPEAMLKELRRIGLPGEDQEGFSQKNFQHYYRAPKMD